MNKRIIFYVIFFGIVAVVIVGQFYANSKANCNDYNNLLKSYYHGIIVNKYIDSTEHSYPTVEIKNLKDSHLQKLILVLDTSGFFYNTEKYDTITKELGTDTIFLINKFGKTMYIVNFGCKESR